MTVGLLSCSRAPEQFVLLDTEFTSTKADADAHESHFFVKRLNPHQPKDWTKPVVSSRARGARLLLLAS